MRGHFRFPMEIESHGIRKFETDAMLEHIGYRRSGPIAVGTDNKAAHDLCHRFTSAQNSRHIDRKLFKMREFRGAGTVTVTHVPTEVNEAYIFTKILSRQVFERHRRAVLNLVSTESPDPADAVHAAPSRVVAGSRGGSAARA